MRRSHSSPRESRVRVLLADDHPLFLDGLAEILEQEGFAVVALAKSGREAISLFLETRPDLGLIDMRMPDLDGATCIRAIRAEIPGAKLMVLSTFGDEEGLQRALDAGALQYLVKDITRKNLVKTLLAALEKPPGVPCEIPQLTDRENDVLRLLVAGRSNKIIAEALHITEGTVKLHVYRIYKKLRVGSRTEALRRALHSGLGHLTP